MSFKVLITINEIKAKKLEKYINISIFNNQSERKVPGLNSYYFCYNAYMSMVIKFGQNLTNLRPKNVEYYSTI